MVMKEPVILNGNGFGSLGSLVSLDRTQEAARTKSIAYNFMGGRDQSALAEFVDEFPIDKDPRTETAIVNIATVIVDTAANVTSGQKVLIWFDITGMQLVKALTNKCNEKNAQVRFFMRDLGDDIERIRTMSVEEIEHYSDYEEKLIEDSNNILIVSGLENPEIQASLPPDKLRAYESAYLKAHRSRIDGTVNWTLIHWPTFHDSQKEHMTYDDYFETFIEACNQRWEEIKAAQALLKEKLDKGKILELFANNDDEEIERRTHLSMSIEGMTFCNSTIDANYPGSEVFSAPVLNSVNGQIFADGEYIYEGYVMKNIHLKIKDGYIIEESYAEEGNKGFQTILNQGKGARYFGEVAFGTNRALTKRFFDDLLNEKVSGSFHMALGHCYTFTQYGGEPVNVNNGNLEGSTPDKTLNHWDLTILMHRNKDGSGGGKVVLDGEIIQEDGIFLDSRLTILNPKFK